MKLLVSLSKKTALVAALCVLTACAKESGAPAAPASNAPLVERTAADPPAAQAEEFRGSFAPGGIAATYRATFSAGRIKTILETRPAGAAAYEFHGARLIEYRGVALGSTQDIELQFDRQGKVLIARAGQNTVSAEEISAIRDRAQSLRSHAVAQRDVRGHGKD